MQTTSVSTSVIGKIVFQKFKNDDFSINVLECENGERISVKGYNLPEDNFTYSFTGPITVSQEYGTTMNCERFQIELNSKDDVIKFIAKNINGIGKKTAEKFYDAYGENTLNAFKDYDKIKSIIKSNIKAQKAFESAKTALIDQDLFILLLKYDISNKIIGEIAEHIENAYEQIKADPFILKPFRVGFQKMNRMAIDLECDLKSTNRISSAILYYLTEQISSRGNLYCFYDELIKGSLSLLNNGVKDRNSLISSDDINKTLHTLKLNGNIKAEKCGNLIRIYEKSIWNDENLISKRIIDLMQLSSQIRHFPTGKIEKLIQKYEDVYNLKLSDKQKLAILTVMNSGVTVITGSAGTGKTTVLNFCIKIYEELNGITDDDIQLLAPTGRASRRMSEATSLEASTIHAKLGIIQNGDVLSDINEQMVFVDEMSMTGNNLMAKLLDNAAPNTRFVFLGDPQQLPSVEAGNVLADLINSKVVPIVKLDVIYRQCKNSLIISNANKIVAGISDFQTGDDFVFVNKTGSEEIQKEVVERLKTELFDRVHDINDVQVITPMRERGYLSAKSINLVVQEQLNPYVPGSNIIKVNGYEFREQDKVICQKNTERVKNGEIGYITHIVHEEGSMVAYISFYGEELMFTKDDLKAQNFALAYAITVHKSQGSEFKSVILPINNENKIMLKRNLLYTAVTRASERMIIVGSRNHYWDAVKNNIVEPRNTALSVRIGKNLIKRNGVA